MSSDKIQSNVVCANSGILTTIFNLKAQQDDIDLRNLSTNSPSRSSISAIEPICDTSIYSPRPFLPANFRKTVFEYFHNLAQLDVIRSIFKSHCIMICIAQCAEKFEGLRTLQALLGYNNSNRYDYVEIVVTISPRSSKKLHMPHIYLYPPYAFHYTRFKNYISFLDIISTFRTLSFQIDIEATDLRFY